MSLPASTNFQVETINSIMMMVMFLEKGGGKKKEKERGKWKKITGMLARITEDNLKTIRKQSERQRVLEFGL